MTRPYAAFLPILFCLPAVPVFAQTTIGSSTCNSSNLNGTYEFILSGRQVTSTGQLQNCSRLSAPRPSTGSAKSHGP